MHVCLLLKATNIKLNVQVTNILDARHDGVTCLSCFPTMCCPEIYICQSHLRLIHLLRLHSHVCCYVQFQIPRTSDIETFLLALIEGLNFKMKIYIRVFSPSCRSSNVYVCGFSTSASSDAFISSPCEAFVATFLSLHTGYIKIHI